jgi:metallo-beta-lactamase family protein
MNEYSAHADRKELLEYVANVGKERLKKVFLVHGEEEQALPLQSAIKEMGIDVIVPHRMNEFELE